MKVTPLDAQLRRELQYSCLGSSLVAQTVKSPPTMRETSVRFLGWEDPLEEERANHSSTLAWRIPQTQEPAGLQSTGPQRVRHNRATNTLTSIPV